MATQPPSTADHQSVLIANVAGVRLITEGGDDLTDRINPRLLSLQLTESREDKADKLDLTLHNADGQLAPLRKGMILSLALGWLRGDGVTLGLVDKGRFTVDEVEKAGPPDVVTLRARSADLNGAYRKRRTAHHKDTTLGAVVSRIAKANGYRAKVHPSLASKPIAFAEQAGKSDMAFVRDLGKRFDATATVKDRTLIFAPIAGGQTAASTNLPALTLTKRDGNSWRFTATQREEHDGAEAQYHDPKTARRHTVRSGGKKNPHRLRRTYASKQDAQAASDAQHSRQQRATHSFEYTLALGDAALIPERPVVLKGWDSEIDGLHWSIKEVGHSFSENEGLTTRITLDGKL